MTPTTNKLCYALTFGYIAAYGATLLSYIGRNLGTLGQLSLPSGSAIASYSATMAEGANRLIPITSTVFGSMGVGCSVAGMSCKNNCKLVQIIAVWALSTGLAPSLPAHISPWVERVGRGFLVVSLPMNEYCFHKNHFRNPTIYFLLISELARTGLSSLVPGGQWIEPVAGLGVLASVTAFDIRIWLKKPSQ